MTAESEWKYSFTDLPKYAAGKEIVYTISEEAIEGYEVTVDGYNLTNTHVPEPVKEEDKNITPNPNPNNTDNTGDSGNKNTTEEGKASSENKSRAATPSKTTNSSNARLVKTGDAANVTGYLVSGLVASLICIIIIFRIRKRTLKNK